MTFRSDFVHKKGDAVASWLVRSTPDRAVRVRALSGDIVLCSWARHLTLTVPLSTQVYEWVPATGISSGLMGHLYEDLTYLLPWSNLGIPIFLLSASLRNGFLPYANVLQ